MVYFGCAPGFACFNLMRGKNPGCIARRLEHAGETSDGAPMLRIEDILAISQEWFTTRLYSVGDVIIIPSLVAW